LSEERLKIAVFIDFDNIEIGVKKTLSRHFDVGIVLEAIKERGEVVTKIAYGDWKHAADYSRALTQHAVHMVQRNLTPGGDKNGADITLALDALEMAFTRSHINTFVIVGGDSDFIALVEKLKQYDKMVFVVGGRSFTSTILQKNCHEFIAYENLIGMQSAAKKSTGRTPAAVTSELQNALPQLRRALEVLADREVSPQLGLLKSTLLQLDSTFSERDYGAHSFREFIQKMANAGFVRLKQVDRSLIVEIQDGESEASDEAGPLPDISEPTEEPPAEEIRTESSVSAEPPPSPAPQKEPSGYPAPSAMAMESVRQILEQTAAKSHWPMYLRTFKHFLRSADVTFDERKFGIPSIHDLARQAQREGLLRIERNRQGILRIYPGENIKQNAAPYQASTEPEPQVPDYAERMEATVPDPLPMPEPDYKPAQEPPAADRLLWPESVQEPAPAVEAAEEEPKTKRKRAAKPSSPRTRKTPPRRTSKSPKRSGETH
jgi:uncharacterized LabA/DUF88 family protein